MPCEETLIKTPEIHQDPWSKTRRDQQNIMTYNIITHVWFFDVLIFVDVFFEGGYCIFHFLAIDMAPKIDARIIGYGSLARSPVVSPSACFFLAAMPSFVVSLYMFHSKKQNLKKHTKTNSFVDEFSAQGFIYASRWLRSHLLVWRLHYIGPIPPWSPKKPWTRPIREYKYTKW